MRNFEFKNNDSLAPCGRGSQSGRSMIEMLGVLAIIGVLSVGGIAGYSKAMMKYRINKTIEQVTLIAGNVRTFFAPQGNYEGLYCSASNCSASGCDGQSQGCPIIKKAKIFPDEMLTVNDSGKITAITNPFGGGFIIQDERKLISGEGDNKAFYMAIEGVPQEACIEISTYDWTVAGVTSIYIGERFVPPIDVAIASQYCSDNNTIELYFDSEYYRSVSN